MTAREKAREFTPEVLLCDIGLPRMDGYEVARAFRQDQALRNLFLIAVSGFNSPKDLQKAADAGFDCHLSKPLDLEKFNEILTKIQ